MSVDVRFRQGQPRERHAAFGEGIVEEIDMQKRAYIVRFDMGSIPPAPSASA